MALYGGGNGPRRDAADRHSLRRRARIPPRPGEGGEWKVRAAGAARGQFRRREHGARARRRCAFHAQRELRLGLRVLPDEHIREGGKRVLRYASGPAAAEARRQRPKPGRLRKERYLRRRARGIRQGGPRRRPARDERGRRDRFAWRHPRRDRLGAGGAIGYKYVAAQKPDGYSLVWNSNSVSTTYHSGMMPLDYRAFDAVARVLVESPVIAVHGESKWKTLVQLVADAKSRPKGITVGNSGIGSHTHISSVALFKAAGAEVVDVPFGAAQVVPSLLGGQVDAVLQLPAALSGYVKSGQMRLLASLTSARDPLLGDVPTAREQGLDVSLEAWRGIAVPKGTPKAVVAALEEAIRKTAASSDFAQASERLGVRPAFMPAEEFGNLIAREDTELARIIQLIGLKK